MKLKILQRSRKFRWLAICLFSGALAAAGVFTWARIRSVSSLPCLNSAELGTIEDVCVSGYSIAASYDALSEVNQRELFSLRDQLPILHPGFTGTVDSQGQFRIKGNRLLRTEVVVDIDSVTTFDHPERWPTVQEFLRDLGGPFSAAAKKNSPKDNKASCDPTNAWTLLKLREEPLRRCLRTMFLLDMTDTFNERTQKLFENQTMKYSDGTTGPLSLKREGLTDSDRGKVVAAVKTIDTKARTLGGYH